MGLPQELIDEIMRYNNPRMLKSCLLTSRAFYSAARPLIHRRLVLDMDSVDPGSHVPRDPTIDQANVRHVYYLSAAEKRGLLRYGYIRELVLDFCTGKPEDVLQLKQLQALEAVHMLTISSLVLDKVLPIFNCCFSQFLPTLRSLIVKQARCNNAHELMEFVCQFPHLHDFELFRPLGNLDVAPPGSKGLQPRQPLPFGGRLVLDIVGPIFQSLLDVPGGIHFHTIEVRIHLKDLAKLLVACSSTLEVLTTRCFDSSKSSVLTPKYQPTEGSPGNC